MAIHAYKTLSYNAMLIALFAHISQNIEIPVLVEFIKTEFGIEHLEYLGDGVFEMDENAFKFFTNVQGETISHLNEDIAAGWQEIRG
jgi:hypothetical protein